MRKSEIPTLKQKRDALFYQKNKQKYQQLAREYYQNNSEAIKLKTRLWYQEAKKDPNFIRSKNLKSKETYLNNREEKSAWHKEYWKKMRIDLLNFVGNCMCAKCGFSDYRALHIDHVNGGGVQELKYNKRTKYPKQYRLLIAESPKNYQVLCANCNFIKRYENNEHRKKKTA